MRIKNLQVSTQLHISLGTVLLFVVLLGLVSLFNLDSIWENARGLYEHPLAVQKAIRAIQADEFKIRLEMKELLYEEDEEKIQERLMSISNYESDAYRQLDLIYNIYLGPPRDIDHVHDLIAQWKPIRDETIRLLREGKKEEAAKRSQFLGVGTMQGEKVIKALEEINHFAENRADQFYRDAERGKQQNITQLTTIIIGIMTLTGFINFFIRKGILTPLKELTTATEAFQQGDMDARSRYVSANEFGTLSGAFNSMAYTVAREIKNKENRADMSKSMILQDDLHLFCQELLKKLLKHTGSQIGAVYLLNQDKTSYEHFESIGLCGDPKVTFCAIKREGELGLSLATQQIQQITDIPTDTQFLFSTVSGVFKPKEIVTIPLLIGSEIIAMISLASIHHYPAQAIQLVNDIWSELTAHLSGVLAFGQAKEFGLKVQQINRELEAQTQELATQTDELTEQNTELEMQKNMLDEASRLKSSFLSNMSHELRTPLNSVIALASVLNRRLHGAIPEEEYSYLEVIERNGKQLLALVNDILDLSRIEAGKEEITMSNFSLQELVEEVVAMIQPQAQEKGVALLNHVPSNIPRMNSDFIKCQHIIQNIISNAVKFTHEGSVQVSAVVLETDIQISIRDTGIGIAPDKLHYIYDEFRQVDETTTRKYGGTGLGLAIGKKYAELLGGSIEVKSIPHEGSIFTLKLPLMIKGSVTGERLQPLECLRTISSRGLARTLVGQGKCIMLVEDSEPAIIQMQDILSEEGYQVLIARNGKEALEKMEKTLPDAMILDLMMPEVDGFQVLKTIRSVELTAGIPVLILTAKHITKDELSFLKGNHIFQLIQKGSSGKKELLTAVENMVWQEKKEEILHVQQPTRGRTVGRPVILVVEDNGDNILTLKALLQDWCDIIEATDGRGGIEQAKRHNPDLILLDISLPVMDGFQIIKEIRRDKRLRNIPVVALTARAMKGDREEILGSGFDGYVSKPIDEKLLEKTIRGLLDGE